MNFQAKAKWLSLIAAFMLTFALVACGGGNVVDEFLNDYEKFIVKYEDLAKKDKVTMEDAQNISKEATDFASKAQKTMTADVKPTEAQMKRMNDLQQRMMKAVQQMQAKVQ